MSAVQCPECRLGARPRSLLTETEPTVCLPDPGSADVSLGTKPACGIAIVTIGRLGSSAIDPTSDQPIASPTRRIDQGHATPARPGAAGVGEPFRHGRRSHREHLVDDRSVGAQACLDLIGGKHEQPVMTRVGVQPRCRAIARASRSYHPIWRSIAPRSSRTVLISITSSVRERGSKASRSIHPCERRCAISTSRAVRHPTVNNRRLT
jgi:hypothetical protein